MAGLIMGTGAMDKSEVFKWYTELSPISLLENQWKGTFDSIELEIFFHRASLIAYSGKETMVKVGTSPGMTGTDLNCAIYTAAGDAAVSGMGVYVHALSGMGAIKYFIKYYKDSVGINDGDLLYVTDPYLGGTHVNDQFLISPIFIDSELVAWIASGCHQIEIGAIDVGVSPSSKNRFGDGMNLTTIKIGEDLKLRDDLVCALANMVRDPQSWILDLKARYAAIIHMRKELINLGKEKGAGFLAGGLRRLIEDTAEVARKKVARFNDGTYRGVLFIDLMTEENRAYLQRLNFAVTKRGDTLTLDYGGTSPQVEGSMNCYNMSLPGAIVMYGMPYLFHDLPTSCGVLQPVMRYDVPEKVLINPDPECSVSNGTTTIFALNTLVHQVFAKMVFDSPDNETVAAPQGWALEAVQYVTLNQRGLRNAGVIMDLNAQGQGGRVHEDGVHTMNPPWAALADCLETEWYEKDYPFVFLFRRHALDSCGFGKYRGGSGIESGWYAQNLAFGVMTSIGGAVKVPNALGLFGGYGAASGPGVAAWKSNVQELINKGVEMPRSRQEVISSLKGELMVGLKNVPLRQLFTGDVLTSQNSGGGGYGDVLERDPHQVIQDVRESVITEWTARNVYKVAYDQETLALDMEKTKELREAEKWERAKRGKKYEDFEKEWSQLKPDQEILKYFGPWP